MLFLTTLLPLITLALRVAAADVELGIPLSHPADVHLPSRPQTHEGAPEANPTIPVLYGSNVQQSRSFLEVVNRQVLAHVRQQMPGAMNLEVFVGQLEEAKEKLKKLAEGVMPKCIFATFATGFLVVLVYSRMECHGLHCKPWRRNELGDNLEIGPGQCERLPPIKIDAYSNPSPTDGRLSPVAPKAPGGHVKRDAARMSYRRRLELE
ncbi:hypothetical protein C8J55DRAFT_492009 [Lentinula edodes]|uniref:Uncharacterized protein n=1 Tax=Lentinula lateritia TaxID=40482 RepID=A0A9W9DGN7_9AGAR|nr:hypothetical protein C8J55DRAFT_492009 [Lentinula edodes]